MEKQQYKYFKRQTEKIARLDMAKKRKLHERNWISFNRRKNNTIGINYIKAKN